MSSPISTLPQWFQDWLESQLPILKSSGLGTTFKRPVTRLSIPTNIPVGGTGIEIAPFDVLGGPFTDEFGIMFYTRYPDRGYYVHVRTEAGNGVIEIASANPDAGTLLSQDGLRIKHLVNTGIITEVNVGGTVNDPDLNIGGDIISVNGNTVVVNSVGQITLNHSTDVVGSLTVSINLAVTGDITVNDITASGNINAVSITATGDLSVTGIGGDRFVRKTADETVNNSTVLQNDNQLFIAVPANHTVEIELLAIQNSSAVADFKLDFTLPAGATWDTGMFQCGSGTANEQFGVIAAGSITGINGNAADSIVYIKGTVLVGATAGNIQFRWAQNTAEVSNTIVRAGSTLKGHIYA